MHWFEKIQVDIVNSAERLLRLDVHEQDARGGAVDIVNSAERLLRRAFQPPGYTNTP